MTPITQWHPLVCWHAETWIPMTILCCEQAFPLTDPQTLAPVEDEVHSLIDHAILVHAVPPAVVGDFLEALPEIALQMRLARLMGADEEDEED